MNLANKITLFRIGLIPIFMLFLLMDIENSRYIAAFIFLFAAATDGLDGYIARSRNQITDFGKFVDPLADKLLISAALIVLVELGDISSVVAFIIIAREFIITGLRLLAATDGLVIAASWWGKLKTITQILAVLTILVNLAFSNIVLILAVIFTIISGVDYIYINRKIFISDKS